VPAVAKSNTGLLVVGACDGAVVMGTVELVEVVASPLVDVAGLACGLVDSVVLPARSSLPHAAIAAPATAVATTMAIDERKVMSTSSHHHDESAKTGATVLYRYELDYAIPPGDIIAELIEKQGMTQVDLRSSERFAVSRN